MEAKHTKGNWQAHAPNPYADESAGERRTYHWAVRTFYEPAAGKGCCGHQVCEISSMNIGTEEADALLIAAAPEMFELLKTLTWWAGILAERERLPDALRRTAAAHHEKGKQLLAKATQ